MISIIVPIYNGEKYIERCIESILCQSFADWELILINDGSSDGSEALCRKYADKYKRIKIISKENEGVSVARNIGIEKAEGEFVAFVDVDDYIAVNYLERLYDIQQKYSADCVFASMVCVDQNGHICNSFYNHPKEYQEKRFTLNDFLFDNWYSTPCVWGGIFSINIIRENCLYFSSKYRSGEDMLFKLQYMLKSRRAVAFTDELYFYFQNPESVVHTINISVLIEAIQAWSEGFQLLVGYEFSRNAVGRIIYSYCKSLQTDGKLHEMMNKEQKQIVKEKLRMIYEQVKWHENEKVKLILVMYAPLIYRLLRKVFSAKF